MDSNVAREFGIPSFRKVVYTFVADGAADDDKIETATYYNRFGNVVGVLTFAYAGSTNNIASIERTT